MKVPVELLPPAAERLAWAVLHSLWQGAAVALALALVLRALRRQSAAARHAACMVAMLTTLTSALVTSALVSPGTPTPTPTHHAFSAPVVSASGEQPPIAAGATTNIAGSTASPLLDSAADTGPATPQGPVLSRSWREALVPVLPWIAGAWIFGVVMLTLRHCGGWWRVRGLRRSGTAVTSEIQRAFEDLIARFELNRAVRLTQSAAALTPMLTGFIKPMIILPARVLTGLGPAEIEAILAHELAHLARRDAWSNLIQIVIETLLFFHPAVWWMSHHARLERENAADDLALRVCTDRRTYAGALVRLAELEIDPPFALAATGGHLVARIRRVLAPPPPESAPGGLGFGLPAMVVALALATAFGSRAIAEDPPIVVSPGESIQAAIDKAPSGAVIQLGAGEWKERIVIAKPLTLQGAGWEKTRITVDEPAEDIGRLGMELEQRIQAAGTPEEKRSANTENIRRVAQPAIWVRDTAGVQLRKLRIQGTSKRGREDGLTSSTLVYFQGARATMAECAVVGPFGGGVHLIDGSDVEIKQTLVAALWRLGIGVRGRGRDGTEQPSRLHLTDSEVRNVYHYGIALGEGCDSSIIERCRISGAAWHGIRYDNASPTITGNFIDRHARVGIYAAGKTSAKVRNNVFWKNEMEGIWCLQGNTDTLEENTFVGNLRGNISVSGARPNVARNIIVGSPVGVSCSVVSSDDENAVGAPILSGNLFHDNAVAVQKGKETQPAPEGSLSGDPKFRDAAKQDFTPAADSPARASKVGASDPLPFASPWPLLAEEKSIMPTDDTRDYTKWRAPGGPVPSTRKQDELAAKGRELSEALVADMFQLEDAARREAAIERMRTAIYSSDPVQLAMGLVAFTRTGDIQFDRAPYRARLVELLGSDDGNIRSSALLGLNQCGEHPDNLELFIRLADDPSERVRDLVPGLIVAAAKRDLTGRGGETILKLLNQADDKSRLPAIRCLWGVKQSPAIEARIVELSRATFAGGPGRSSYDAMYYALSTQPNRGEAAVKRCIELLADQDAHNVGGRIAWGFGSGVSKEFQPLVAEAMMRVVESRNDSYLRRQSIDRLRQYGTSSQLPALRALLAKPNVAGEFRQTLESIAAVLEKRPAESAKTTTASNANATQTAVAAPSAKSTIEKPEIEVEWQGKWWPATVLKKDGDRTQIHYVGYGNDWDEWVAAARIRPLTSSAAPTDAASASGSDAGRAARLVEINRQAARQRASQDNESYNREQQREIEALYQVANTKGHRTDEAKASLKELLRRFDKANRTGCATLYLGQASTGDERVEYLTRAVEKFSDCYYFNGCQVGGYGRYVLALTLWDRGDKDKARALLTELKTTYKDATDHSGRPMDEVAEAAEKELEKKP
jgi:beta-lactamase regulating signal transducer with metallopeptidase domain/nitrous oxidase accessory protein NosD